MEMHKKLNCSIRKIQCLIWLVVYIDNNLEIIIVVEVSKDAPADLNFQHFYAFLLKG